MLLRFKNHQPKKWNAELIENENDRYVKIQKRLTFESNSKEKKACNISIIVRELFEKEMPLIQIDNDSEMFFDSKSFSELEDAISEAKMVMSISPEFTKTFIKKTFKS